MKLSSSAPRFIRKERKVQKYLSLEWGVATVNSETGETEYQWATAPYQETDENGNLLTDESGNPVMNDGSVSDGIGKIDKDGLYTAVAGGTSRIACMAKNRLFFGRLKLL
ncbi:MAG: hypothetical protein L6V88_00255 [Anaerotruncus sp.]|nr:MAG: hypothetical protein L6V88_00255 [Anaerotruncus sp.]